MNISEALTVLAFFMAFISMIATFLLLDDNRSPGFLLIPYGAVIAVAGIAVMSR